LPELPDVEAIIGGIKGEIVGRAIKGASILDSRDEKVVCTRQNGMVLYKLQEQT
jgi:hypothetical protein